jgi:gamma-glutamyltranspeptidase/glutathione hydrolase
LARSGFLAPRHLYEAVSAQVPKKPPIGFIPPPPVDVKDPLATLFAPGGQPLVERERVRRPELAKTIEAFAHRGPAAFYQGSIGEQLVKAIAHEGGIVTAADLRDYKPLWKDALHGQFRGNDVWTTPAPGGGLTALETLNILDARPPLTALGRGSSASDHVVVEALKHAFADRARSLGDPAFVPVPTERLLSTAYAKELAARIHDDKVGKPESYGDKSLVPPETAHDGGTSHLCVADGNGNVVSMTSTVNLYFGARFSAGTTGVVLNDEMDDFSAQPGVPNAFGLIGAFANAIAPGKRPTSSTSPMILTRDGAPVLCVGAAGGPTIISATVQTIVNVIDFGLDVQAAVNAPRVHAQWMPDVTAVEVDVPRDVQNALTKRGHKVKEVETLAAAQAIGFGPKRLTAASDPRYGGAPAAP